MYTGVYRPGHRNLSREKEGVAIIKGKDMYCPGLRYITLPYLSPTCIRMDHGVSHWRHTDTHYPADSSAVK